MSCDIIEQTAAQHCGIFLDVRRKQQCYEAGKEGESGSGGEDVS